MEYIASLFSILVLPLFFGFLGFIFSRISRWSRLAKDYPVPEGFEPENLHICFMVLNKVKYKSMIRLGPSRAGLYMKTWFIFRIGHTPTLIPWPAIRFVKEEEKLFGAPWYYLEIREANGETIEMIVSQKSWEKMEPFVKSGREE